MYECGTGKRPLNFADLCANPIALVMRLVVRGFPEGVAPSYKALAEKCWDADPGLRPHFKSIIAELKEVS